MKPVMDIAVCAHQIAHSECPYCELKRLRSVIDAERVAHNYFAVAMEQRVLNLKAALCDCEASGNNNKPKQHGADLHAKNCRVYST
jgi:hypothetical protein